MSKKPVEVDICVVGNGPVGAAFACLLGLCGVSVIALERAAATYHLPRAIHFDDEVMRVFQAIGLADRLLPLTQLSPGMRFVDAEGRLLLEWLRPQGVTAQGWNGSYRFHQPDLERLLHEAILATPGVTVRTRADVFAIAPDADGVCVRYEDLATGRLASLRARYVVGCDGARSLVRRLIGSDHEDLGFHERWLVVDAVLRHDMPELGDHSVQHCDPARPSTYVRGVGARRRWELTMLPGEDPAAMTAPDVVWRLLSRWITPADAVLERAVCYTFHSTVAERWRGGRLLIAGDAAHQTPPFLGQGLCAGIRDAANLAWKLARVVQGRADEALLDSYQTERAPHVRDYIEAAVRLGGLINTTAAEAALPPGHAAGQPAQMRSIKPALGPGLAAGWTGPAGRLAPQPRLANGRLLDEVTGYRFAALMRPEFGARLPAGLRDRMRQRNVAIVSDDEPELQSWLQATDAPAVVVRPDRYVLGGARDGQEMEALVEAA